MTVKELYEWAVRNNAEDLDIEIYTRGDFYYGDRVDCEDPRITVHAHEHNTAKVVLL